MSAIDPAPAERADAPTVPVRAAATVMLVRDGDRGLEVCMLRRNLNSDFVGGAYVFPGGAVDPADGAPEVEARCDGRSDADASAALGLERGGLAFWIAAIRETFEEAGLLPAHWDDGRPLNLADPVIADRFAIHREAVDRGERRLVEVAEEEGLRFELAAMHYVSHWVTPAGSPRRYDTRFFLAAAPAGQHAIHDDREVIAARWMRPQEALDHHAAGEWAMLPPTTANLAWLAEHDDVASALASAAAIASVPMILPRVLTRLDGSATIVMPDDPDYGEGYAGETQLAGWKPFTAG